MPPKKVEAPKLFEGKKHFDHTLMMLVVLMLLGYLLTRIEAYYFIFDSSTYARFWSEHLNWLYSLWRLWQALAIIIICLGTIWWIYSVIRRKLLEAEEEKIYGVGPEPSVFTEFNQPKSVVNEKWAKVLEHMNSVNPSDWRLAIIEADIMLDELLTANGYHGDSVGDKLKGIEPSDMLTLDAAWEAHKVRNRIAHSGSDFELNERETKRVIALFESVFKEYEII